jgi:hypothetical protein
MALIGNRVVLEIPWWMAVFDRSPLSSKAPGTPIKGEEELLRIMRTR